MTSEIQQNRYDQLVRRVAGIIGPGSKVSEVLTELFPMIDVENPPSELLALGGTRLAFGGVENNPGAGNRAVNQIFNPADSGTIITVTAMLVSSSASMVITWGTNSAALPTQVNTEAFADSRLVAARPIGQIRIRLTPVAAVTTGFLRQSGGAAFVYAFPNDVAVLSPGNGLEVGTVGTAIQTQTTFYWRERTALPSELSLPG